MHCFYYFKNLPAKWLPDSFRFSDGFFFVTGNFAVRYFAVGYFAVGYFAVRKFRRKEISP